MDPEYKSKGKAPYSDVIDVEDQYSFPSFIFNCGGRLPLPIVLNISVSSSIEGKYQSL